MTEIAAPERLERPRLDATVFLAPGAVVVGDVDVGPRSSLWYHAVVRGDSAPIRIGAETNLQDHVTVHVDHGFPALLGSRVTVGHRAIVHGCVVEDACLIGMGAIVLSGARVGKGSLIGAGALIREGQEIPPGSVALGVQARITGQIEPAHRQAIADGAEHYVALARRYLTLGYGRDVSDHTGATLARASMTYREWNDRVETLAATPAWIGARATRLDDPRWRESPRPGAWSALEVLAHLRDADREVFRGRIERILEGVRPRFENVDLPALAAARGAPREAPAPLLAAWTAERSALIERLAPLGPQAWELGAVHAVRGPFTLGDLLRVWVEHDLGHRRQIALALGERP